MHIYLLIETLIKYHFGYTLLQSFVQLIELTKSSIAITYQNLTFLHIIPPKALYMKLVALLFQGHLPKYFWYLINRTCITLLKLFQVQPSYNHLKVFGCLGFASTHFQNPSKLMQVIRSAFSLVILWPKEKLPLSLGDVLFYEDHFPFSLTTSSSLSLPLSLPFDNPNITHPSKAPNS